MVRISQAFFNRHPVECARELIGGHFHWDGCAGRIVETEAYLSIGDEACHTWFRPTARAFVARHPEGTAYVYLNYGVHWMFNIMVKSEAGEGFVLIRALEPLAGIEAMRVRRPGVVDKALASGPGKLTRAMGVDGLAHGAIFLDSEERGIYRGAPVDICAGPRIGISKARDLPWRFGDPASRSLSRKFP